MTKVEMLKSMDENGWNHDLDPKSTYAEVKEEYETMISEYEDSEFLMYPNGRDYDAENLDD